MVKRTLEAYDCDVCGERGERYTITFPDGMKVLDRCDKHNRKVEALRAEHGEWTEKAAVGKAVFKVSTLEEIKRQQHLGQ